MYRIETAPSADPILAKVPGLRTRVEKTLTGILETAGELRRIHSSDLDVSAAHHLRIRVADYLISYRLDLDRETATVVFVEHLRDVGGGSSHAA